jgi:regulator of nonsense transcripts 2
MLPWDAECLTLMIKCLANVYNVKYGCIGELASVASGLNKYHSIGVPLVDSVLEEVRVGLEMNDVTQRQRRIAYIKYLAELYTYQMFQDQVIFDTLYLMMTFGHGIGKNGEVESIIDPPGDYFRIRLISILLDSTGEYFSRGSARRRLERFLIYFQRYICMKDQPLPVDVEHMVTDLYFELRPKQPRLTSLEEATAKIVALEADTTKGISRDRLVSLVDLKAGTANANDDEGTFGISSIFTSHLFVFFTNFCCCRVLC